MLQVTLLTVLAAQTLIVDDSLRGSTTGDRRGGSFTADGWRVDGQHDAIIWHLPATIEHGAVELKISGLRNDECGAGMQDKAELFHMYDWTAGDADNVYSQGTCTGYRNTPFKHFMRKAGCLEAFRNRDDSLEMLWQLSCFDVEPNYIEPDTAQLDWDPSRTYLFREEWGPDGAGNSVIRTYRDGDLIMTMSLPGAWRPNGHAIRIAASPRSQVAEDMGGPQGATYSDIRVWDLSSTPPPPPPPPPTGERGGAVRLVGNSLVDDGGPFLGLGFTYMTALWRTKYDRDRLRSDLAFMSQRGFNYLRMLSMVGWYSAWEGLEIAPVDFTSREGVSVAAWPDYWQQVRDLIDIAWDEYGIRTQITVFADAQLMPDRAARVAHLDRMLRDVVAGREEKIILIEIANEAWQNGFPGADGVAELRDLTAYAASRTDVLVAISAAESDEAMPELYTGSEADIATWHFSRDLGRDGRWYPVRTTWMAETTPGLPPVSSNEPIGPGSSVASENDPTRLVMAAAYAFVAKLPMYVYHTSAGVFGRVRFEDMPAAGEYAYLPRILPPDLASWTRNDGNGGAAPFHLIAGALEAVGARRGGAFVTIPIAIGGGGVELEAREALSFKVYDPNDGRLISEHTLTAGERLTLPQGRGAYILTNYEPPMEPPPPPPPPPEEMPPVTPENPPDTPPVTGQTPDAPRPQNPEANTMAGTANGGCSCGVTGGENNLAGAAILLLALAALRRRRGP